MPQIEDNASNRAGRPRSEAARRAILDAALELLRDEGSAAASIQAIAQRAGVSRQTIYRWWSHRGEIVLEALLELGRTTLQPGASEDPQADLRTFLRGTVRAAARNRDALALLMTLAQEDAAFAETFDARFIAERRAALGKALTRAGAPSRDVDEIADLVFGALWYRLLVRHAPLDQAFGDLLARRAREMIGS